MGLVRTFWLVTTLVIAGPAALMGVLQVIDGEYTAAAMFLGLALVLVVASEYVYLRITDRTVGNFKRLISGSRDREPNK